MGPDPDPTLAKLVAEHVWKNVQGMPFSSYAAENTTYTEIPSPPCVSWKVLIPQQHHFILAYYDPVHVPVFSDENCFAICTGRMTNSAGWDRKINYTMNEYKGPLWESTSPSEANGEGKRTGGQGDRRWVFCIMHLVKGAQQYISHTTGDNDNDVLWTPIFQNCGKEPRQR